MKIIDKSTMVSYPVIAKSKGDFDGQYLLTASNGSQIIFNKVGEEYVNGYFAVEFEKDETIDSEIVVIDPMKEVEIPQVEPPVSDAPTKVPETPEVPDAPADAPTPADAPETSNLVQTTGEINN